MIERLMNLERTYGEPEYSKLSKEISLLRSFLYGQVNQEGQEQLELLADLYMRQEHAVIYDAFAEGFWTAVEMMLEFERWKNHS